MSAAVLIGNEQNCRVMADLADVRMACNAIRHTGATIVSVLLVPPAMPIIVIDRPNTHLQREAQVMDIRDGKGRREIHTTELHRCRIHWQVQP